jgi:hypothetical protein
MRRATNSWQRSHSPSHPLSDTIRGFNLFEDSSLPPVNSLPRMRGGGPQAGVKRASAFALRCGSVWRTPTAQHELFQTLRAWGYWCKDQRSRCLYRLLCLALAPAAATFAHTRRLPLHRVAVMVGCSRGVRSGVPVSVRGRKRLKCIAREATHRRIRAMACDATIYAPLSKNLLHIKREVTRARRDRKCANTQSRSAQKGGET